MGFLLATCRPFAVIDHPAPVGHRKLNMATKLDLSGLICPLPALKTRKALTGVRPGERIEVVCTDPLAAIDIPSLLAETGDRLLATEKQDGRLVFVIEKTGAKPAGGG